LQASGPKAVAVYFTTLNVAFARSGDIS